MGKTFISKEDIDYLHQQNSAIAEFCLRSNQAVVEMNKEKNDKDGFDLPDPTAMAVAIDPQLMSATFQAYATLEIKS